MAVADDCVPQVGVCSTRVAPLNTNGTVASGGAHLYVTDALLKMTIKPNFEAGDEVKEKNGCGAVYVDYKGPDSLLWYDVEMEFLTVDPYLVSVLVPTSTLIQASGSRVGWAAPRIGQASPTTLSVEFYSKRISGGALSNVFPYAHHALPQIQNAKLADRTIDANAQHVVVDGQAVENANWFDGPANDWPTDNGAGGYLPNAWKWIPSSTNPTPVCGFETDIQTS